MKKIEILFPNGKKAILTNKEIASLAKRIEHEKGLTFSFVILNYVQMKRSHGLIKSRNTEVDIIDFASK